MNKGFILDGFPRNTLDAQAIFLESIPEDQVNRDKELPNYPGF